MMCYIKKMETPAIIFEDNHIIVAIKPQNVGSCPDDSGDDNLQDQLRAHVAAAAGKPTAYLTTVHRLDRVTGGVMVYAKTSKAAARLSEQIKENAFDKKYLTIVIGEPKHRERELVDYLLKNEVKNIVTVVPSATKDARRAELKYQLKSVSHANKKFSPLLGGVAPPLRAVTGWFLPVP